MTKSSNTFIIRTALVEDINSPYLWFSDLPCPSREIVKVKVTNKNNSKSIWCEVIKASNNYIKRYNQRNRTYNISRNDPFIVVNSWYRVKLGIKKNEEYNIEIKQGIRPRLVKQLCASYNHPDNTVRLAVILAIISVGLGLLGLILGFIPLLRSKPM